MSFPRSVSACDNFHKYQNSKKKNKYLCLQKLTWVPDSGTQSAVFSVRFPKQPMASKAECSPKIIIIEQYLSSWRNSSITYCKLWQFFSSYFISILSEVERFLPTWCKIKLLRCLRLFNNRLCSLRLCNNQSCSRDQHRFFRKPEKSLRAFLDHKAYILDRVITAQKSSGLEGFFIMK